MKSIMAIIMTNMIITKKNQFDLSISNVDSDN